MILKRSFEFWNGGLQHVNLTISDSIWFNSIEICAYIKYQWRKQVSNLLTYKHNYHNIKIQKILYAAFIWSASFMALLEGNCATFNSRNQALKLNQIQSRIFIRSMLFWRYHGEHEYGEN